MPSTGAVLALLVAIIAAFLSMDIFKEQRMQILDYIPTYLKTDDGPSNNRKVEVTDKLLAKDELQKYDGSSGSPGLYLACLGQVFDVSSGGKHYGPGGSYEFFAAKDASRAYVSGDFTEKGLVEDIAGLGHSDVLGLEDWLTFYHKTYKYVGKLIGHYYTDEGEPTPALRAAEEALDEARKWHKQQSDDYQMYPRCNSKWSQADGTTLWCSDQSGGIKRDWDGVPRQYHKPGATNQPRCACIRTSGPPGNDPTAKSDRGDLDNPQFRVYTGCHERSNVCELPKDD